MENINTNPDQKDIKPKETGLEEVGAPLEMAEVEEAQKNLEKIDKLPEEEKLSFMQKLGKAIQKIPGTTFAVTGGVVAVASMHMMGTTFEEVFTNINPGDGAKVQELFTNFTASAGALLTSVLAIYGGRRLNKEVNKHYEN